MVFATLVRIVRSVILTMTTAVTALIAQPQDSTGTAPYQEYSSVGFNVSSVSGMGLPTGFISHHPS